MKTRYYAYVTYTIDVPVEVVANDEDEADELITKKGEEVMDNIINPDKVFNWEETQREIVDEEEVDDDEEDDE